MMTKWSPQNDDPVMTLAAIRWYAISIEKLAQDIYVTRKGLYPEAETILREAFHALGRVRKTMSMAQADEEGCPPGYVNCNGACLPDCDPMEY